jgi:hypothetical protein
MDPAEQWRTEADDAWLASHRSTILTQFRRRFRRLGGGIGAAVSNAEMGPYAGAPRNPTLRIGGKAYAVVRYARHRIAYTAVQVEMHVCEYCGRPFAETDRVQAVRESGGRVVVGAVRMCRSCQSDSWMFRSHMPSVGRARQRSRKIVL